MFCRPERAIAPSSAPCKPGLLVTAPSRRVEPGYRRGVASNAPLAPGLAQRASNCLAMRIWGYVLLVLGLVFLALFALAQMGGAHLGFLPWFVSLFLVMTGWTFVTSARGLVRHTAAPTISDASKPVAAVSETPAATVEMPMSPSAAGVIARQADRNLRVPIYVSGGFLAFFILLGAVLAAVDKTPGEGLQFLAWFAAVGVASAVMILGITWLSTRPLVGDKHATFYLRTSGPMQVATMPIGGGAVLRLADRSFVIGSLAEIRALSSIKSGTVEYSPRGHVILAAWDGRGEAVYSAPGYAAAVDGLG